MRRWSAGFGIAAALALGPSALDAVTDLRIHASCARAVLLDPVVFRRLHTDMPSRQPLLLSDRHLAARELDLDLPFPVRIVTADGPERAEAFEFISAVEDEKHALVVTFKFPPEGLVGRAMLRHEKGTCVVLDRDVYEKDGG
jgi:hypothetical protein